MAVVLKQPVIAMAACLWTLVRRLAVPTEPSRRFAPGGRCIGVNHTSAAYVILPTQRVLLRGPPLIGRHWVWSSRSPDYGLHLPYWSSHPQIVLTLQSSSLYGAGRSLTHCIAGPSGLIPIKCRRESTQAHSLIYPGMHRQRI